MSRILREQQVSIYQKITFNASCIRSLCTDRGALGMIAGVVILGRTFGYTLLSALVH